MSETKYGANIVTELQSNLFLAPGEKLEEGDNPIILNLDDNVVKGAFLVQASWDMPGKVPTKDKGDRTESSHKHDFDEVLAFFGTDPNNPHDLGAELEVWIGGEKHTVNKSCLIFVPKGVYHCPIYFEKMTRPIFHFMCGMNSQYSGTH
jgi:hypothetical protein